MIDKKIQLTFNSTVNKRVKARSNCELYSHDKNNNEFELTINNYTLTNEEITVLFKFVKSIKYWETQGKIEDNKIKFKFDTSLITENERVNCYIILKNEEKESDIYSFSFDVKMSEYDLKDNLPVKERYFANSVVVDKLDVLTKEVLAEELEKAKGTYALRTDIPSTETIINKAVEEVEKKGYLTEHQSLAGYVTETQLNEKGYLTEHQDISKLATKEAVDNVAAKVTQLESRPVTSSYDDSEIKRKLKELEDRPTTANIDTSNFVTNAQLEEKHYLTEHQDISKLATKEQLDEVRNSQPTVDNLVTKEQLRKAFLNEEGQEKYVDLDTFVSATRGVLGSSTNEKGVEEYFNEVTTGLSEESKETYIGDIYKNATETKVYRKNGFTNFKDMMYALAKVFPDNYNYKDENQVVNILTNRNYQEYIKSSGNVDTSDFATKDELRANSLKISGLELKNATNITKFETPFKTTGLTRVEEYLNNTAESIRPENYGRLYSDTLGNHLVVTGGRKTAKFETLLYTVGSSLPEAYEPDFEFSEGDNIKFITSRNIHNYLPTNTGNTGNTTELDNRLKVLESKQWEIHGRGMPNGTVTAPIGTTYVDEAVTNGALKWIKKSGTGNTGWEVLIGDTGWKVLPSVSKLGNSFVKIRRVNNVVSYQFGGLSWGWFGIVRRGGAGYVLQGSDRERNCYIIQNNGIPAGYRTEASLIGNIYNDKGIPYGTWYLGGVGDYNQLRFQFTDPVPTDRDIGDIRISSISYLTNEPWPQN